MVTCLLLGSRRRIYFIKKLREELSKRFDLFKIIYSDTDFSDPAKFYCDKFYILPASADSKFEEELLSLVKLERISLIFTWNDADILNINKIREKLECEGARVVLPSIDIVDLFNDKYLTTKWAFQESIKYPKTIFLDEGHVPLSIKLDFPVIAKPRYGQGSFGVVKLHTFEEFTSWCIQRRGDYLIQEVIAGQEFTVDVFQIGASLIFVCPRKRIKVRGGECLISKVLLEENILKFADCISKKLSVDGVYNFQVFLENDQVTLIEFNPRFGGGSDLTIEAGGNIPGLLLDLHFGKLTEIKPLQVTNNLVMTRYFASEFFIED